MKIQRRSADLIGRTIMFRGIWWQVTAIEINGDIRLRRGNQAGKLMAHLLPECHLYPTLEEVSRTYPRLIRTIRWGAILTQSEAEDTIRGYLTSGRSYMGSEAVAHFGGAAVVIDHSVSRRHIARKTERLWHQASLATQ